MSWLVSFLRRLARTERTGDLQAPSNAAGSIATSELARYLDRAERLRADGMPQQALAVLEQVTAIAPESTRAWQLGFELLVGLRNEHEAVDWGLRAFALLGDAATSKFAASVSAAARQSGRSGDAESVLANAQKRDPDNAGLWAELGWTLLKKGEYADALQAFRSAEGKRPDWPMPSCGAASALRELGRDGEATDQLETLLASHPNDLSVLLAVAQDRKLRGLPEESLALLAKARALFPGSVEPLVNMGPVLARMGDNTGVIECLEAALEIDPRCAPAHLNLSLQLLALGRFAEGWRHYQYRHRMLVKRNYVAPPSPGDPTVQLPQDLLPMDFAGKKITLVEDQGLGDELSFLRFAPWLRQRGATTVYMPDPRLRGMVERAGIVDRVAGPGDDAPADTDVLLACGDLPLVLGHGNAAELPRAFPLTPLEDARATVRKRLATLREAGKPLVGLTWRAGHFSRPRGALFKEASLEALALVLKDLDVTVLCLQREPRSSELEAIDRVLGRAAADFSDLNRDLELMLALLDELDDYVAVSNTNVHLRAGLGKTARILVPHPPDYRWMASGDESPWFPGFRIYRQAVGGAWDGALNELQADLWQRFAGRQPPPEVRRQVWPAPEIPVANSCEPRRRSYEIAARTAGGPRMGTVHFVTIDSLSQRRDGTLDAALASTRYRVLLPGTQLARRGYEVRVHPRPMEGWRAGDAGVFGNGAVVFSKSFSDDNVALARQIRERGGRVVVDVCDNHFDHPQFGPPLRGLCEAADDIVASSAAMARAVEAATGRRSHLVEDPVEGPRGTPAFGPRFPALKALWFGHPSNLDSLRDALPQLVTAAARHPIELTLLTRADGSAAAVAMLANAASPGRLAARVVEWSTSETWRQLAQCDLVVIPSTQDERRAVKSPNRLLEAIWAGRLAVAHPVPSYQPFGDYCRIADDLAEGIAWAVEHQAEAVERIRAGQDAIAFDYSAWKIAGDWARVIGGETPVAPIRLNLGCGDKILPGYLNVDIAPSRRGTRPDVTCDLRHLPMFPDGFADEILVVHIIERFPRWEIEGVLAEWLRILQPGGQLVVESPNLVFASHRLLDNPLAMAQADSRGRETMWVLYGDPAWKDPLMSHHWGYTPQSLQELLQHAGLRDVHPEAAQFKMREPRDMRVVGTKAGGVADARGDEMIAATALEPMPVGAPVAMRSRTQQETWDDYFLWFHQTGTWKRMTWHGIRTLKFPGDMWNYQEIIFEEGIDWVVETGTRHGGSALFFAETLAARNAIGRVISIDIDAAARQVGPNPRLDFLIGDSGSTDIVAKVASMIPERRGPLFLILDSDHAKSHVLRELDAWVPCLRPGDYLVVEDTSVNGHPARPDHGPGPWEALDEWMATNSATKLRLDEPRNRKFGATAAPRGYFKIG